MRLTEAQLLTETTPVSSPEYILGSEIYNALYNYLEQVKAQMQEEADAGDTHGATAAKLWSDKITKAMDKLEYDDYGEAILKLLGLDNFNPYYPEESAQVHETKPEPAKTSTSIYSNKAWDVNSPTYNGGRRLGAADLWRIRQQRG